MPLLPVKIFTGNGRSIYNRPMQLCALDRDCYVVASSAVKGRDYRCPECSGLLRVRSGPCRQPHFFHVQAPLSCSLHKKSLPHLRAQLFLQALLPESRLEVSFPSIGRIADVFWEPHNLVFEIQCSPISLEEARARCSDYARIGLTSVWILHDGRFNRRNVSAAEGYLRASTCYFTNIDAEGDGYVYDQCDLSFGGKRVFKGPPLRVHVDQPLPAPHIANPPSSLEGRAAWPLCFRGDLLARATDLSFPDIRALEQRFLRRRSPKQTLARLYRGALQFVLESLTA